MAHEVELKLRIQPADAARLRRHPAIRSAVIGKPITRKLISIYYDTPQLALLDAGISLRVRRMAGIWSQTVKGSGRSLAGLHQRMEWEDAIASGHPDFSKITEPALTEIFDDEALRTALIPIFSTEVRRTEWNLTFDNGDQVELALDLGELVVGEKREPINEIELELKGGNAGRLFDLALDLQQDIPLELENISKAQRGYAHYRPQPPAIVKARAVSLDHDMSAHAALKQIAWECLSQLQGNQDMVLEGEDIEGVHQMRVALRRLRSMFAVFRHVMNEASCTAIKQELRWITGVLGAARDLDVFITQTLPPMLNQFKTHPGLQQLRDKAVESQCQTYVDARTAISSQRYHRFLLSLGAWLENERWRDTSTAHENSNALEIAQATLARRYKQLRRHGRRLMHMHPEERHTTRIAAKKLRYAAEFFYSLYPEKMTRPFTQALAQLQDILGVLNDIAVTENLIRQLIGKHPVRALDESLHIFSGWNACEAMHRLEVMESTWRSFKKTRPFWN